MSRKKSFKKGPWQNVGSLKLQEARQFKPKLETRVDGTRPLEHP